MGDVVKTPRRSNSLPIVIFRAAFGARRKPQIFADAEPFHIKLQEAQTGVRPLRSIPLSAALNLRFPPPSTGVLRGPGRKCRPGPLGTKIKLRRTAAHFSVVVSGRSTG